ncbi:fetal and adult testis-expressed transcript protein [Octodon degus]|uniref:Fetal and adult testis-expressed transcript protein n=1 Tax=Octodon degus TaxID=10160 RepID=A0A6P6DPR0_OCTDE|nr:fetal and adult testis-expressed transcript protein [Octodon degus]
MATGPPGIKEEIEMCLKEELMSGNPGQHQEQLLIADAPDHGSQALGGSQRRQRMDPKATASTISQSPWNTNPPKGRRVEHQRQAPRMSREPGHEAAASQEYPGSFQGHPDQTPGIDLLAEVGLEELNELELEIIRRQLVVVTERLCALEDQDATWRLKEAVFFTMMLSACIANLWLWMRQ